MKHYVVIDLEMSNVERRMKKVLHMGMETIQIGAVLLNDEFDIIDSFNTYVKPQYSHADSFITGLTGIKDEDLADAPVFEDALAEFVDWLPSGDVVMVSWSFSDRAQLSREMENKGITCPRLETLFETWVDAQQIFDEKTDSYRASSLTDALNACDINASGNAHNGLDDARNTALLFKKLMTEPVLQLNPYYAEAKKEETTPLTCSLGDLFSIFNLAGATAD
ncbi:MAG: 3'-5' exonuclease [Eubacteriales bacterium]|nr:3'-5' exonuclease [Eubacteriales bacterium]